MARIIRDIRFIDLIPPNLKEDKDVQAIAEALDVEMQAVNAAINECLHLPRLEELPEAVLDHLAWQWHVDFYEATLGLKEKQELVRRSIAWHKRKGTPFVVKEVISTVFAEGKLSEWYQYGGKPYFFRVETAGMVKEPEDYNRLHRLITAVKNTRSWLESIRVNATGAEDLRFGIALQAGEKTTLMPAIFKPENVESTMHLAIGMYSGSKITIRMGGSTYGGI